MTILPDLGHADACPICRIPHAEIDDFRACPHHGHELVYDGTPGERWRYTCPVRGCGYERWQTKPPARKETPMTTTPAIPAQATGALAIRQGQDFWDAKQLAALRQLGVDDAPNAELAVFFHRCQQTGLDPFSQQICMIKRRVREGDSYTDRWTIQTEIDGYRVIARRAARRDGKNIHYGPPVWYDENLTEYPVWVKPTPPAAAAVTVYVDGAPFPGIASYTSFVSKHPKTGQPMGNWKTMPDHMVAKCAEAQALRKAFPHDLADIHMAEIMPTAGPVEAAKAWHAAAQPVEPPPGPDHDLSRMIVRHWQQLGIDDADEQAVLTGQLAGVDFIPDTPDDLNRAEQQTVIDRLAGCDDIGQVRALIDRGDKPGGSDA